MDIKKIAEQTLKEYPGQNEVHITSDGQAFFNLLDATNHASRNKFEAPKTFFREGHEPEDAKEMEEALQLAEEKNTELTGVVNSVIAAADLNKTPPEVSGSTHDAIAAVVSLREAHQKEVVSKDEIVENVTRAADLVGEAPTVTDETPQVVKAVIELRNLYQTVQNELDTLKASSVEVKKEETKDTAAPANKK